MNESIYTQPSRRQFLAIAAALAARPAFEAAPRFAENDAYYKGFQNPPAEARPFFRWWWNGNRIERGELSRELRLMRDAGAGGVEINPIALPETYTNPPGDPVPWLSDEWNQLLKHTVDECRAMGLTADLIAGTGWPFGGRFLSPDEWIQGLTFETRIVEGPAELERSVAPPDENAEIRQLVLAPVPAAGIKDSIDLPDAADGGGTVRISVPPGRHQLIETAWRRRFRDVMHGAPGADGPVLDHFNKTAVNKYLNRMSAALNPLFGGSLGNAFRSLFCDSIELNGANWTSDFSERFGERRGYAIEPYLPWVLNPDAGVNAEFAETLRRVRQDYSRTLSELFMERFILAFHEWCRDNGVQSRYQAYGFPWLYTDLLEGYRVPDIPEGDQWLFSRGWMHRVALDDIRYAVWNKYASSGAHLMGRKTASCEAMTNTRGVFEASPEYIKQATDINIVTGINHLVLHGFNYSPPEAGFPGWIRYGTYFNEHNPWWRHMPRWSAYAARLCWAMQESKPVSQVAIMGPTLDIHGEHGLDRNPWITKPWYLHELWQALNHHGYCSDYVNGAVLSQCSFGDGEMSFGPMRYPWLIVAGAETLEAETLSALERFAEADGKILFIEPLPRRLPGLMRDMAKEAELPSRIQTLIERSGGRALSAAPPAQDALVPWIGGLAERLAVEPAARISNPDPKLFMIRKQRGNSAVLFFSNMDRGREIAFEAHCPGTEGWPWEWDAESGERIPYPFGDSPNHLRARLRPLQSLLIVYENRPGGPVETGPARTAREFEVQGPWRARFEPVAGEPFEGELPSLTDFAQSEELYTFAGTVSYRTYVEIPETGEWEIDPGRVHETAEVFIDGEFAGLRWWGNRPIRVNRPVKAGRHELEIKTATLLYNYCRTLDGDPSVRYWLERSKTEGPRPAGLVGPVRFRLR